MSFKGTKEFKDYLEELYKKPKGKNIMETFVNEHFRGKKVTELSEKALIGKIAEFFNYTKSGIMKAKSTMKTDTEQLKAMKNMDEFIKTTNKFVRKYVSLEDIILEEIGEKAEHPPKPALTKTTIEEPPKIIKEEETTGATKKFTKVSPTPTPATPAPTPAPATPAPTTPTPISSEITKIIRTPNVRKKNEMITEILKRKPKPKELDEIENQLKEISHKGKAKLTKIKKEEAKQHDVSEKELTKAIKEIHMEQDRSTIPQPHYEVYNDQDELKKFLKMFHSVY